MPLTSHRLSVVYHRDFVRARQKKLTVEDVAGLNAMQCINSRDAIFTYDKLSGKDLERTQRYFGRRRNPKAVIDRRGIRFDLPLVSTLDGKLSFLSERC